MLKKKKKELNCSPRDLGAKLNLSDSVDPTREKSRDWRERERFKENERPSLPHLMAIAKKKK